MSFAHGCFYSVLYCSKAFEVAQALLRFPSKIFSSCIKLNLCEMFSDGTKSNAQRSNPSLQGIASSSCNVGSEGRGDNDKVVT